MAKPTDINNLNQILEGVLFAYGESISLKKLAELTKKSAGEVYLALENIRKSLAGRGIKLVDKDNHWQLVADKSSSDYIEKLVKSEMQEELTPASLEALAVVAYRGPVSKNEVEGLRGVNSSYVLRNLTLRGLIEKNESTKPQTYHISLAALRKLGLEKEHDLPHYSELKNEANKTAALIQNQ